MIGKLQGIVDSIYSDYLILMTNSGVGYQVYLTGKLLAKFLPEEKISLYIEAVVKEDGTTLFGFSSSFIKRAFNLLRTVSGVGPKMSLNILNYYDANELQQIINQNDKNAFKIVSGVGPKIAERIILELKNKNISEELEISSTSANSKIGDHKLSSNSEDAVIALVQLGISRNEAFTIIRNILANEAQEYSTAELIKMALQFRKL